MDVGSELTRRAARTPNHGGRHLQDNVVQGRCGALDQLSVSIGVGGDLDFVAILGFRVLRPNLDPVWRRVAQDQTIVCLGDTYRGRPLSTPTFARPLPAIWMTRWHARLIGIEVGAVQSEAVCSLGVEQCEPVSELRGAACTVQEAFDPGL
jgi:hypothetical protein